MNILVCHKQEECDLEKFWKLESLGIDAKEQNDPDLAESIENYLQTPITKKNDNYITKLPWRENAPELPTNEDIAKRRTESVIRRLKKDPEMFRKYGEIITDQEQRGFIEKRQDSTYGLGILIVRNLQNVAGRDKIGDNDDIVKILGMRWDRESDDLKFQQIEFMEKDKMITKREVLRTSSRIFDPLGLITPIT
ncbi:Hypothetical predicted protein, partial [Mytilus galloprovincialis]